MIRSYISYVIVILISIIFNIIPRTLSLLLGKFLGLVIYYIFPVRKKVAIKNIKDNFSNLDSTKYNNLLKNTYAHFGMVLSDFMRQNFLNKQKINDLVNINAKTLEILNKNKGSIIMTGHIGNWEYFLPILGLNHIKFAVVTQKIKNSYLNKFFTSLRSFQNVKIIPRNDGKEKMFDAMNQNYHLGLASDQNAGSKGTMVPFLNTKISIPKGAAIFHIKTKKPILVGFCTMNKDNKYDFNIEELKFNHKIKSRSELINDINSQFTSILGKFIRKYPDQYFWFHKMKDKSEY
ncbi:MAG: hypothetical protein CBE33_03150 [Candidatus Pelagibacter sp. TMED273]|mgnify:FL=1|nr:MAG: hypothetical protein CBE33_03150 [Candidatus Pelagibacter sp. TMED273]